VVEFWLCASVTDDAGGSHGQLFKKMSWPMLPRVGEWVDDGTHSGTSAPIESVWHWWDNDPPRTDVMIEVFEHDFEKLRKDPDWIKDPEK
jgi:hypothetical protein